MEIHWGEHTLQWGDAHPYLTWGNTYQTLLPPNATALERALEAAIRQEWDLPTDADGQRVPGFGLALDADTCPSRLLVYLGANRSLTLDEGLTEAQQRALIKASFNIHQHEATVESIEDIIIALGYTGAYITEGLDDPAHTHWYEFSVSLNSPLTTPRGEILLKYINEFVPLTRQLKTLSFISNPYVYGNPDHKNSQTDLIYGNPDHPTHTYGRIEPFHMP